jgi:DNA-directed RNA polymerase subunit RPC12/RpoP
MKPIPLKLSVKSKANRWFAWGCLAVMFGTVGILIVREGIKDNQQAFIIIGIALPFIFVIGEMIRFRRYCGRIPAVMCIDCRHEFDIKELCKTGKCPECRSTRVVGVKPDDDSGPVISLYV